MIKLDESEFELFLNFPEIFPCEFYFFLIVNIEEFFDGRTRSLDDVVYLEKTFMLGLVRFDSTLVEI